MAVLDITRRLQGLRRPSGAVDSFDLDRRRRRARLPARPLRLRQVDAAAHGRRLRDARPRGTHHHRRRGRDPHAAREAADRHGVPEPRALDPHERLQEPRLRPEAPPPAEATRSRAGSRPRSSRSASPATATRHDPPALRRPAAARGARPLARARAEDPAARRALRQPRPAPARAPARGGARPPAAAEDHHALRHPRPGRGAGARRPHRRHARRPHRADRAARRRLPRARDALRRRLHRHDEPDRGRGRRRRRSATPASPCRCRSRDGPATLAVRPEALGDRPGRRRGRGQRSTASPTTAPTPSSTSTSPTALRLKSMVPDARAWTAGQAGRPRSRAPSPLYRDNAAIHRSA